MAKEQQGLEVRTHDAEYDLNEFELSPFGVNETKRLTVPAAEEVLYQPHFTDHGFVRLIDYMGGDQAILHASTGGVGRAAIVEARTMDTAEFFDALRAKGIENPFKFAQMKVQMEMPIAHALFWVYNERFKVNEYSGRYSEMMETARQVTKKELRHLLRETLETIPSEKARTEYLDDVATIIAGTQKQAWGSYQASLAGDLARELARIPLGTGTYTKFYVSANLVEWADVIENAKKAAEDEPDHGAFAETLESVLKRLAPEAMTAMERDRAGQCKKQRLTIDYDVLEQSPPGLPRYGMSQTKRVTVPAVEKLLFIPQPCMAPGWFMPTDYMGDDTAFVQSARVSYGKGTTKVSDDITLVRYLRRHRHTTPFEHVTIQAEQKTPMFVWPRQGGRHRTFDKCGVLRRYPLLQEWYDLPDDQFCSQSRTNRQGRGELLNEETREMLKANIDASATTQRWSSRKLREKKVPEWVTEFSKGVWRYTRGTLKVDVHNAFHFLRLRDDDHAQHEIRLNARQWATFLQTVAPHASQAFLDYEKNALTLTVPDQDLVARMFAEGRGEIPFEWYVERGWTRKSPYTGEIERGREALELDEKIEHLRKLMEKTGSPTAEAPSMKLARGKLIVIDGTDGSGKGTQTALLLERLHKDGYSAKTMSFPTYGTKSNKLVELYLNKVFGSAEEVSPKQASGYYAFNRFWESERIIKDLEKGICFVLDRYVSSNAGHQGGKIEDDQAREEFLEWLFDLEFNKLKVPQPDLTLLLHVPAIVGQQLVGRKKPEQRTYLTEGRTKDVHEADLKHLQRAEKSYLFVAQKYPGWKIINCLRPELEGKFDTIADLAIPPEEKILTPHEVHEKVYALVKEEIKK